MEKHSITALPVVTRRVRWSAQRVHDLLRAGVLERATGEMARFRWHCAATVELDVDCSPTAGFFTGPRASCSRLFMFATGTASSKSPRRASRSPSFRGASRRRSHGARANWAFATLRREPPTSSPRFASLRRRAGSRSKIAFASVMTRPMRRFWPRQGWGLQSPTRTRTHSTLQTW